MSIEERISAAGHASMIAANAVQSSIVADIAGMTAAWKAATAEADAHEAKCGAIKALTSDYEQKLARFSEVFPDGRPRSLVTPSTLPPTLLSRDAQGAWIVSKEVTDRVANAFRDAQSAAREASGRRFAGKQRDQAQRMAEAVQGTLRALDAEVARLTEARKEALTTRATEAVTLRSSADARLKDRLSTLADAMRRLPPGMLPWMSPSWFSWTPSLTHSHVLLGMLRPQPNQAPGSNHNYAWDVRTPAFLPIRDAVRISHRRHDRDTALALVRSILLRALACTPPGKLRLSIFDPTGLGQSVSSLLELGEYDRDLIGGKVWSSTDDLRRLLGEHASHVELVIQKYLRAEYATLEEFNAAAGAIAEPYRLLVIIDAPSGFDQPAFAELHRVVENGPRCGVGTLLVTNESVESPHGVSLDSLPPALRTIRPHLPFGHTAGGATINFELSPETDLAAPATVVKAIVEQVGRASQEGTTSAVTFDDSFGLFIRAALDGRKRGLPRLTDPIEVDNPSTWWGRCPAGCGTSRWRSAVDGQAVTSVAAGSAVVSEAVDERLAARSRSTARASLARSL